MDKMRYAIYARYSSDLQRPTSNEDQIRNCRRCEKARSGVILEDCVFTDEELSGSLPMEHRPGLSAMLKAAGQQPKPFDYVLVDDTSRLSRNEGETAKIIKILRFSGVQIFFVSQGIDTAEDQSYLTVGVHGVFDAHYRHQLGQKTLRGMRGAVVRGYNAGGRVYGYKYIPELDPSGVTDRKTGQTRVLGTRIEIDEEQAPVVGEIFSRYADGLSVRDLTHGLNQKGYHPPHNGRQAGRGHKPAWIPATVRGMLQNPKYVGDWTYNKAGWVKHPVTGQRRHVLKPEGEWELDHRPERAIVDTLTWEKVQKRLEANRTGPQRNRKGVRSRFLLSGLMKCHVCGGSYVVVTGTDRSNPLFGCCTNWNRGGAACSNNFRVGMEEIQEVILRDIQKQLLSPAVLSAIVKKVNQRIKTKIRDLRKRSTSIQEKRRQEQWALDRLLDAIEKGVDLREIKPRIEAHRAQRDVLDRQIEALKSATDLDKFKADDEYVEKWLFRLRELVQTDPIAAKAKLTSLLGAFTLSPEMVDGVKCLRLEANAKIIGLLKVAGGERFSKETNTGGRA